MACAECSNHLHQLHVCLPSEPGRTRLLYRMSLDFAGWAKFVPASSFVWTEMANQVLGRRPQAGDGAAGPDAAGRAGVGAPRGVR